MGMAGSANVLSWSAFPGDWMAADPLKPWRGVYTVRQLFAHAPARVRPSDRDVLLLTSWDGLSNEQAARVLELSERSFAVRLHRARRRLESALQDAEGRRPSERRGNP
jgi:DNA-directed RNA polymerase specialized sigma24 family protein